MKMEMEMEKETEKVMNTDFTPSQWNAYKHLISGKNLFLTGPAGTGKSYVISKYRDFCTRQGIDIAVTSSTGVSALLIDGTTIHSYCGIGLGVDTIEEIGGRLKRSKFYKMRYQYVRVLVIDEISMISGKLFTKLDGIFKIMRGNFKPFGGVQLIITGDFLQLPPVNTESNDDDFAFQSPVWKLCFSDKTNNIILKENMRQSGDELFQKVLCEIRMGECSDETLSALESMVGKDVSINGVIPTRLFGKKINVDRINNQSLEKLLTTGCNKAKYKYHTHVNYVPASENDKKRSVPKNTHERLVQKLVRSCPALDELNICIGSQVMLLCNLDIKAQLVNGSRGIVTSFKEEKDQNGRIISKIPVVRFVCGQEIPIPEYTWTKKELAPDTYSSKKIKRKNYYIASYSQIPLKLAYACTIHKSQGGTLDCASMKLDDMFEYGQFYTALSRVKDMNSLSITALNPDGIRANPTVLQFYQNIL